jgi:hypothetical protein
MTAVHYAPTIPTRTVEPRAYQPAMPSPAQPSTSGKLSREGTNLYASATAAPRRIWDWLQLSSW